jgi:predicted SAM-dependent methyltransferase
MIEYTLLNLGCGQRYHKRWTNVDFFSNSNDVISANLLKSFPFPDCSFDVVYHSHLLEHFPKESSLIFIRECFRVLHPGGRIRVVVPDLENMVQEYLRVLNSLENGQDIEEANYEWIVLEILDQMVRSRPGGEMLSYLTQKQLINDQYIYSRVGDEMKELHEALLVGNESGKMGENKQTKIRNRITIQNILNKVKKNIPINEFKVGNFRLSGEVHQWMYDRYSLKNLLRKAGFDEIQRLDAYVSNINNWADYELDIKNGIIHKPNSLFMEAIKPLS